MWLGTKQKVFLKLFIGLDYPTETTNTGFKENEKEKV
jgi:hypothetical protein